jgi:uncharacterized Fe-S center protein
MSSAARRSAPTPPAVVHFADVAVTRMETDHTLPAKFQRLLRNILATREIRGKAVGIKMHFGGNLGYTTIHPVFVRILVQALQAAGARSVKVMDNDPANGLARGYTREVLGCEVVSVFGATGKYVYREKIGFKTLDEALFGGEAADCDFFIDFSHLKGHGACGFGGAHKNIAMGVVPGETRGKIHRLEGGIRHDPGRCNFCGRCRKECPNEAIRIDAARRTLDIFFHHCTYCRHCVLVCPHRSLVIKNRTFEDFSKGLALVTARFLRRFPPENLLFINVLLNITLYCDCWGFSTAALVPDIGILASDDIVAVETASLDRVKTKQLLPNGLPLGRKLGKGRHLFEKIHGKDPYRLVEDLRRQYGGSSAYTLEETV